MIKTTDLSLPISDEAIFLCPLTTWSTGWLESDSIMVVARWSAFSLLSLYSCISLSIDRCKTCQSYNSLRSLMTFFLKTRCVSGTRGPKGHISCTWVLCATFLTDQPGRQFLFTHRPENTNLVEDIEILLSVKFHWILFSGFRGEFENVSANQMLIRPSYFFPSARKTQTW